MRILLLADIHGNYPALRAIDEHFASTNFDAIVNCGDSLVYAPFANEVINWLMAREAISILGNTDKKVISLLRGEQVNKPRNEEKRVMYTHTARQLTKRSADYLCSLPISAELKMETDKDAGSDRRTSMLGIFHGSPARPHEFLFDTTPQSRFAELASEFPYLAIVTGHSHSPYHYQQAATHFINPGSVGRMFDGNPSASCAILVVTTDSIEVSHHRITYQVDQVVAELARQQLPEIYQTMYIAGKKLN